MLIALNSLNSGIHSLYFQFPKSLCSAIHALAMHCLVSIKIQCQSFYDSVSTGSLQTYKRHLSMHSVSSPQLEVIPEKDMKSGAGAFCSVLRGCIN